VSLSEVKISDQAVLLKDLIGSLNQAEGACSQLIHHHSDPRWMFLREAIHVTTQGCLKVATFEARKSVFLKA
jgi:hypothetical protein